MKHKLLCIIIILILLGGCQYQPVNNQSHPAHKISKGIYRCTAINTLTKRARAVGSSRSKQVAKKHALNHCRSRSAIPDKCQIHSCRLIKEKRLATNHWYTCYVQNRERPGVWSGTSRTRFTATSQAFSRCRKLSGNAASCYVDYCRSW